MSKAAVTSLIAFGLAMSLQLQCSAESDSGSKNLLVPMTGHVSGASVAAAEAEAADFINYKSIDSTIAFDYPKAWGVLEEVPPPRLFHCISKDRTANASFTVQDIPKDTTLEGYVKASVDDIATTAKDMSPVQKSSEKVDLAVGPTQKLVYGITVPDSGGTTATQVLYITVKGNKGYLLCCSARNPVEPAVLDVFKKMADSLQIKESILPSVTLIKQEADAAVAKLTEFKDEATGVTAKLPSTWKMKEDKKPAQVFFVDNGIGVSLIMTHEDLPADYTLDAYAKKVASLFSGDATLKPTMVSEQEAKVNGVDARRLVFTNELDVKEANGQPLKGRQVVYLYVNKGKGYGLVGSTVDAWWGLYENVFDTVSKTISFAQ